MNEKQMQEMAVSILLDEYTQLDVAQLLKEYEEDEENGEVPNVSDALDEKCSEMIQRQFAKKKRKKIFVRISKVLSRVAMVTLMLIGLCTVSVLSVKAWREPALRFVLETFDRYSTVSMDGKVSHTSKTPEEIIESLKEKIPQSYDMLYFDVQDGYYQVKYVGDAGEIINLSAKTYQNETYFDTEVIGGSRMRVNDNEVIFLDKNGFKVIWLDEESELLIEIRALHISERAFWAIVHQIIK